MSVRVTVTLPEGVLAVLDEIADAEGVSRSDVVREASARYVASRSEREAAYLRQVAVEEGIDWLLDTASRQSPGDSSLEMLQALRGAELEGLGRPLDPDYEGPGIP